MSKIKVQRPNRDPDYYSKRDVPYWFAPEWIRGTSAELEYRSTTIPNDAVRLEDGRCMRPPKNYGRVHPVKEKSGDVNLYMKAKDGNLSYIQGSIQKEFKRWHEDRQIDYLLLGMDPDEILATED
jgi:hypothetical protein